jgi:predicted aspartyl protease
VTPDGGETRWTYNVILRNTGHERIEFESLETHAAGPAAGRGQLLSRGQVDPLRAALEPDSELRLNLGYTLTYTDPSASTPFKEPGREGVEVAYRLRGADASGRPLAVAVRIRLDSSAGRTASRPRAAQEPPAAPPAPPEPAPTQTPGPPQGDLAVLWEAARECEGRFPGVQTLAIDRARAIQIQSPSVADQEPFATCFRSASDERLAGRVARPDPSPRTTTVALELVEGHILVVPVTLNERLETRLVLDTGATKTILSPMLIGRLGLRVPEDAIQVQVSGISGEPITVSLVRIEALALGGPAVEGLYVGVHAVPLLPRGVEGLLGADVLHHYRVDVDRAAQRLRLD